MRHSQAATGPPFSCLTPGLQVLQGAHTAEVPPPPDPESSSSSLWAWFVLFLSVSQPSSLPDSLSCGLGAPASASGHEPPPAADGSTRDPSRGHVHVCAVCTLRVSIYPSQWDLLLWLRPRLWLTWAGAVDTHPHPNTHTQAHTALGTKVNRSPTYHVSKHRK